jgi:amino acid transporter
MNSPTLDEKTPLTKVAPSSGIGRLTTSAVFSIVFFNVSGGPIGSEGIVGLGGPILGLVGLLLVVLFYSVPLVLMTAELSTAFPRNGGYSIWVKEAFGNFWGLQEMYYSWSSGVVDNALYPILLYSSAQSLLNGTGLLPLSMTSCEASAIINNESGGDPSNLFGCIFAGEGNCAMEYFVKVVIMVFFTLPTLFSNRAYGFNMVLVMVFVLLPFAVMCAIGLTEMRLSNLAPEPKEIHWMPLLNVIFWSVSGFDCCSTFAGEIDEPKSETLPRALWVSLTLMVLCYVLCLGIGAAVDPDWRCWTDGSLPHVAQLIGGNWLGIWVLVSTLVSSGTMYGAELFEDSYQMLGMSEAGLLPKFFAGRLGLTGTPVNAIAFQVALITLMLGFDFSAILVIDNAFYIIASTIEFAALLKLRIFQPELVRPYKIPLGTAALSLFCMPALVISATILYLNVVASGAAAMVIFGGVLVSLPLCAYGAHVAVDVQLEEPLSSSEHEAMAA